MQIGPDVCPGRADPVAGMKSRWIRAVAAAIAAAVLFPGWARAAPIWPAAGDVEEHQEFGTPISGFGGWLAWSRYDAKRRVYRLVALHEGGVRTLAIRSRSVPFDVDLGPDARGHTVAVYSRCREEPVTGPPVGPFPFYRTGRGCRLYEYRFPSARERQLSVAVPGGRSLFMPAIWRERLVFAASADNGSYAWPPIPRIFVRTAGHRPRAIRAGNRGRSSGNSNGVGPSRLDIRGQTVVYAWGYLPTSDACGASEIKASPLTNDELVVQQLGGSRKVVAHGGCPEDGDVSLVGQPQLTSTTTLSYVVWRAHSGTGFVRRLDLAVRRRHDADLGSFRPESFATDGQGTSILSVEDAHGGGSRITSTQLAFAG